MADRTDAAPRVAARHAGSRAPGETRVDLRRSHPGYNDWKRWYTAQPDARDGHGTVDGSWWPEPR